MSKMLENVYCFNIRKGNKNVCGWFPFLVLNKTTKTKKNWLQAVKRSARIGPLQPPFLSWVSGLLATSCGDTRGARAKVSAQMRVGLWSNLRCSLQRLRGPRDSAFQSGLTLCVVVPGGAGPSPAAAWVMQSCQPALLCPQGRGLLNFPWPLPP